MTRDQLLLLLDALHQAHFLKAAEWRGNPIQAWVCPNCQAQAKGPGLIEHSPVCIQSVNLRAQKLVNDLLEVESHDPRVDPKPGDIVRRGGKYGGTFYEVADHYLGINPTDVPYYYNGLENAVSLNYWRETMADAEVIRCVPE